MKKILAIILALHLVIALAACAEQTGQTGQTEGETYVEENKTSDVAEPVVDEQITAAEATGTFTMETQDGTFTNDGNVYTITAAGTYTTSGLLNGQILIDAG